MEKAKIEIAGEDFREGLTAVISIKVAEPQFEGQTKTKLGNSEVSGAVQQAVGEALTDYLEEHPNEAKMICNKVILAATARVAARKARESVQRKNVMSGGGLLVSWQTVLTRTQKTAKSSLSRVILRVVQLSRDVTVIHRLSSLSVVRF